MIVKNQTQYHLSFLRKIPGMRPLLFDSDRLFTSRGNQVFLTRNLGESFDLFCTLKSNHWKTLLGQRAKIAQRILRVSIYRMRMLSDGTCLFSYPGGIFVKKPGEPHASISFATQRGSRPVSLAVKPGGLCVFSEYWSNREAVEVPVYGSRDSGATWETLHLFSPGSIRHVHGITYDPYDDCFWICTGDRDNESLLLKASADFSVVKVVRRGKTKSGTRNPRHPNLPSRHD